MGGPKAMNEETRIDYLVGVFGFLQLSMKDVGLLNAQGVGPKKRKKLKMSEQDALAIYDWVGEQLQRFTTEQLRPRAQRMDKAVTKLNNDHKVVNNFLLSLMLLRHYMDTDASLVESILMTPKINRLVDVVDSAISDEEFSADIKRTTARTADNLYRQYAGMAMLSDEVRDLKYKRIKR